MLKQCPACEQTTGLEIQHRLENFEIKGEIIKVEVSFYYCKECGKKFGNAKELGDPFRTAYDEYRRRKGMVTPEDITNFRKKYNLTQKELSELIGFGGVTLSRYENGALQDQTHDSILKMVMEPYNLIRLINQNELIFSKEKLQALNNLIQKELPFCDRIDLLLNNDLPNEFNGYMPLQYNKVAEVISFFCYNRDIFKTKLMKLLFYSDFIHFKKYKKSITGLKYAHLPYGPVPDGYELILGYIIKTTPGIYLEPKDFGDYSGELIKIEEPLKLSVLNESEKEILKFVSSKFEFYTSKALSTKSHLENAYNKTNNSDLISYTYAEQMDLFD